MKNYYYIYYIYYILYIIYNNMPTIVIQPLRSPPRTRLRPRPLTARQRSNLRIRRLPLENELNTLNATLSARTREYGPLA
jgi:hypothetical protein